MTEYLDVLTFAKNETTGKWRATKLGYAKPDKEGTGWDIYLDALPIGGRICLRPQRERDDAGGSTPPRASQPRYDQSPGPAPIPRPSALDDDIPF